MFWLFLHPGIHGVLVSDSEGNRDKFRLILRSYTAGLPPTYRYPKIDDNKAFMSWRVGGKLSVLDFLVAGKRKGSSLGNSRAYRFAHLTETSEYGDERDLESFLQTLSETHEDRLFLNESTANGYNHFHTMCEAAKKDVNGQRFVFTGWWAREDQRIPKRDKRYRQFMEDQPWTEEETELRQIVSTQYGVNVSDEQLAWYRWRSETKSIDEGMLHQTQPWTEKQAFVLSGRSFFPLRKVEKDLEIAQDGSTVPFIAYRYYLGQTFDKTTIERIDENSRSFDWDLKVWEDPLPWGRYAIGVDPAYGRSDWGDSHAISVHRCFADRMIQVAEYGSTEPETFQVIWALAHLASLYTDCVVNFEVSGPGIIFKTQLDTLRQVLRAEYMRDVVMQRGWENVVEGIRWYLFHRPDSLGRGYAYGTKLSNADQKIALMNEVRDSYCNDMLILRSVDALSQMQYIVQDGSEISGPKAPGRSKDDFVFAAAYAHRAWLEWVRPDMIASSYTYERAMLDDQERRKEHRPNAVRGIVEHFFRAQNEKREEAEQHSWRSDRGFR